MVIFNLIYKEKTLENNNYKDEPLARKVLEQWWLNNDCLRTYECKIQGERIGDYSEQILTDISREMVDKNL